MDRQSRPLTGEAQPQGRPMGAAFRAREFRRSASLTWEGEGFETDNLARQSAGMRRAATLPLGSTNVRRNDEDEIEEACRLLSPHPEEPRAARRLEGWRRSPLQPTLRDARRWRAPQGEAQGQTPVWRNEPENSFGETNPRPHFGETNPRYRTVSMAFRPPAIRANLGPNVEHNRTHSWPPTASTASP
jgi:hypothetical protein